MEKKLTIQDILSNGVTLGLKNFVSLIGCVVLYVLTCWIPYINIGTTIAMACLPLEMAKGTVISPTAIFDKKYFKYIGEYFLIEAFIFMGVLVGTFFFFIPGMVIAIAWSLGVLIMIDKGVNPLEALTMSNKATTGYKWTIFLSQLVLSVALGILNLLFGFLGIIGVILMLIVVILVVPIILGMTAYIYSKLVG